MKELKTIGKDVGGNEGDKCNYNFRLDTYGCGCQHDCSYCYAKSLLDFRGLWNPDKPSVANISKLINAAKKYKHNGGTSAIRLGGMTDCFQPVEKLHRNTYKLIKALNRLRIPYLIITKSSMIADEEYMAVMDKQLAHIQFTLTFTDDDRYRAVDIEHASLPSERIKAIEKLEAAGFDTQIRLSPYIPEFIDFDILNNIQCEKVLVEFLRINHWTRKWLADKCDLSGYTTTFHGYDHLPFEKKKELIDQMGNSHTITVCDFEPEHLDYWKKEFNPDKEDCCNLRRVL